MLEGKQHFTHGVQLKIVTVIRIIKTSLFFHCLESNSDFLTVGMIYSSFWLQHDFLSQSTVLNSDFSATSTSWNSVRYSQCRVSTVSLCQIALILSINSNGKKNLISEILNCLLEWNPKALWRVSVSRLGGCLSLLSLNDHYHFFFFLTEGNVRVQ